MQVILLERIDNLGAPGSEVSVKRGYARNWLFPQKKAILATEQNRKRAVQEQAQISARDEAKRSEAESVQQKLDGKEIILVRSAGESGQLYGSVRTRDIAEAIEQQLGIIVSKKLVALEEPVRSTGIVSVPVRLHPQVPVAVSVNVAPSEDEAKRQALKRDQALQRQEQADDRQQKAAKKVTKKATDEEKETEKETETASDPTTTEDASDTEGKAKKDKADAKNETTAKDEKDEKSGEASQEKSDEDSVKPSLKKKA